MACECCGLKLIYVKGKKVFFCVLHDKHPNSLPAVYNFDPAY